MRGCASVLNRGCKDAGSAWAPEGTFWQEDEREEVVVSGTKWDLGVARESCEPALGLRLRGPEECVAWAGLSSPALVLWSTRLGTGPSFPEAAGASGLLSGWDGGLAGKIRQKFSRSNIWRRHPNIDLYKLVGDLPAGAAALLAVRVVPR